VAPVVLVGVVAVGLAGRVALPSRVAASAAPVGAAAAPVGAAAAPVAEASSPVPPVGAAQATQGLTHRQREEGTDGLMGSLPFGIPGDTPYAQRDLVNRFTIDDVVRVAAPFRTTPPWIRRNGALTS
jgi:hypothetical protein